MQQDDDTLTRQKIVIDLY
jgi:hypothetical protein